MRGLLCFLPRLLAITGFLTLATGCGADTQRAGFHGKITLDGKPVESGSIRFQPMDGTNGVSAGSDIHDGAYDIPREKGPSLGTYRVEIISKRKTGRKVPVGSPAPPGTMADEVEEMIPERYNTKSKLRQEVTAGSHPANFELVSTEK